MPTIERLEGPLPRWRLVDGQTHVELAPTRGALVTSYVVDGVPVLFMDEATLLDSSRSVRGGVPLLFPIAGKPPAGSPMSQHGFARTMPWEVISAVSDDDTARVECRSSSSPATLALWPFPFEARFAVSLFDRRLMLEFSFENRGPEPMPLHFGLHPYFCVGDKQRVKVQGAHGRAYDNAGGVEREVASMDFSEGEVDLHFTPFTGGSTTLDRGDGRRVELSWTEQFSTLVVWTLPGKPFVCVEPWTAKGMAPARLQVAPGATERLAVSMSLETT
ncbi:MAG: aldose epimerase [Archangium sp.]|nr:aldose epimerase [Archangium sp.]